MKSKGMQILTQAEFDALKASDLLVDGRQYYVIDGVPQGLVSSADFDAEMAKKVDKEEGKGLTKNELTDALKTNYGTAYTHAGTSGNPHGADADDIDDTATTNKFVTAEDKENWNNKVANTSNILIGDGAGNAVDSGISASTILNTLTATTTTGNPISILNTNDGFVDKIKLLGNTIGGNGTPETPIAIQSVESPVALLNCGKNLISNNVADWEQGTVDESLAIGSTYSALKLSNTTRIRTKELIRVKNPITFSFNDSLFNVSITLFDENQLYLRQASGWSLTTFTETRNCEYMAITVMKKNPSTITTSEIETVFLQGELGTTATEYKPYQGETLSIPIKDTNGNEIPLRRAGTAYDSVYKENGKWYLRKAINEQVLNGSEIWNLTTDRFFIPKADAKMPVNIDTLANLIATTHQTKTLNQILSGNNGVYLAYSNLGIRDTVTFAGFTVANLKTWLSTHNITIAYELATPEIIELHEDTATALESIKTYQGTTNIFGTNTVNPIFDVTEFQLGLESVDAMLTLPNGTRVNVLTKDRLIYITSGDYAGKTLDYVLQELKNEIDGKAQDSEVIKNSGDQTIAGVKTFSDSPIIPDATTSGQAVNKGQLDTKEDSLTFDTTPTASSTNPVTSGGVKTSLDLKANDSEVVKLSGAQTIADVKTFSSSPIVPNPTTEMQASPKQYVDTAVTILQTGYDLVIRTQAQFNTFVSACNGGTLTAKSVLIVGGGGGGASGEYTLSTTDNSGIKLPATLYNIHGINLAKIVITNFLYDVTTAKGGLWYDTAPTTPDYSIRDLEVDCTGTGTGTTEGNGFYNCTNLTNCTGTGTGEYGYGFYNCTNLTNCTGCTGTGTGEYGFGFRDCTNLTNCTGTGTGINSFGFYNCTNLTNCTGTGTGEYGYGFRECTNLTNCEGKGIGTTGYGFTYITYATNCKDGGSTTAMWNGTNKNIDLDTCRKTPVEVTAGELTTLNT